MTRLGCVFNLVLAFWLIACSGNPEKRGSVPNDLTGKFHLPAIADSGHRAYIKSELLYPLTNKPTPECHASTIVETPAGLVTAFFAGTYERHPDVGIRVSRLVDGEWTRPEEVVNGVQSDTLRYPCWNPVLFQPLGGDLML